MKITLINGEPAAGPSPINTTLENLTKKISDHEVDLYILRDMNLKHCTGCWGCWVKTPGECSVPDDTIAIRRSMIRSEWVLFASPVILGYTSALMKIVQDKSIPLLHPYIEMVENECHHESRYERYPLIGLIYQPEPGAMPGDGELLQDFYRRYALNFKSELAVFHSTEQPINQLVDEINHTERIPQGEKQ